MPRDCTPDNTLGGILDLYEGVGNKVELNAFAGLKNKEKMGYAKASGTRHAKGTEQSFPKMRDEIRSIHENSGIDPTRMYGPYFSRPDAFINKRYIKAIEEAANAWKGEVIANKLDGKQGMKLWAEMVAPTAKAERQSYLEGAAGKINQLRAQNPKQAKKGAGALDYELQRAENYFEDMINGPLNLPDTGPISATARRGAGWVTAYDSTIAMLDVHELLSKGLSTDPAAFAIAVGRLGFTKGPKMLGRLKQNEALYFGSPFYEPPAKGLKAAGQWANEYLNPQYYSNNLLTNVAAEMGRINGQGAQEMVQRVAFIPSLANTPEYMRRGAAEITWARYSTEALKYYMNLHLAPIRAMGEGDLKKALGATTGLGLWYGINAELFGSASVALPGIREAMIAVADARGEDSIFDKIDNTLYLNNIKRLTGIDASEKVSFGFPALGLAYSFLSGTTKGLINTPKKVAVSLEKGEANEAAKALLKPFFLVPAIKYGPNVVNNKSALEWLDLAIDAGLSDMEPEEVQTKAIENMFGHGAVVNE